MRIHRYIYESIIILSLALLAGCTKEEHQEIPDGTGTVYINISTPAGTKSPLDAGKDEIIRTLSVWLTNTSTGKVEKTSFTSPDAESSVVTLNSVERGDHKLYILANYTGLDSSYKEGSTIDADFLNKTSGPIEDKTSPSFTEDSGIPSSIVLDVSVAPGSNTVSAELVRIVGRMSITFKNAVQNYDLYIGDIVLSKRNISEGYLFQKEDHSKPGDAVDLNFPSLGDKKKISENSMVKLYDHYLFETSNDYADPFTLSFAAGLYPNGTPESSVEYTSTVTQVDIINSLGNATNQRNNVNDLYLIKHSSGNHYMCVEGESLVLKQVNEAELLALEGDEIKKYLWRLSSTGNSARIIHDQTKKEIRYEEAGNASLVNSGDGRNLTVSTNSSTYIRFAYRSYGTNYYIAPNSGYTGMIGTTSSDGRNWSLRKVTIGRKDVETRNFTGAEKNVSTDRVHTIKYIDKYGLPVPLEHICRNEHVDIIVNIQYNSETGDFDFAVEPWGKVENETTFD